MCEGVCVRVCVCVGSCAFYLYETVLILSHPRLKRLGHPIESERRRVMRVLKCLDDFFPIFLFCRFDLSGLARKVN